jgi:hypothetical protein
MTLTLTLTLCVSDMFVNSSPCRRRFVALLSLLGHLTFEAKTKVLCVPENHSATRATRGVTRDESSASPVTSTLAVSLGCPE